MSEVLVDLRSELGQYSPYCQSKCTSHRGASGESSKCESPSAGRGKSMCEDAKLCKLKVTFQLMDNIAWKEKSHRSGYRGSSAYSLYPSQNIKG
jgi:hypothetical protein